MAGEIVFFVLIAALIGLSAYAAAKGLSQEKEREDKWARYEHRDGLERK